MSPRASGTRSAATPMPISRRAYSPRRSPSPGARDPITQLPIASPAMNAASTVATASAVAPKTWLRSRDQTTSCIRPAAPETRKATPRVRTVPSLRTRGSLFRPASSARRRSRRAGLAPSAIPGGLDAGRRSQARQHGLERRRLRARVEPPRYEHVGLGVVHGEVPRLQPGDRRRHAQPTGLGLDHDRVPLAEPEARRVLGGHHDDVPTAVPAIEVLLLVDDGVEL